MSDKIKIDVKPDKEDYRMLMQAFKVMPKEAQKELRASNKRQMTMLANKIKSAARNGRSNNQQEIVATSIRANSDRFPSIVIGGSRLARVSRKVTAKSPKPAVGQLVFGVEFGAGDTKNGRLPNGVRRFPTRSKLGYFIFPTLKRNQERIRQDYLETVYKLLKKRWG